MPQIEKLCRMKKPFLNCWAPGWRVGGFVTFVWLLFLFCVFQQQFLSN